MFTYPIAGASTAYAAGAFEDAIAALSPRVWYKFDDASFATTVNDYGSIGDIDLTKQSTTAATAGPAMRSDRSQSFVLPAFTAGNWATEGAHYTDTANAFNAIPLNGNWSTMIFTVQMIGDGTADPTDSTPIVGHGPEANPASPMPFHFRKNTTEELYYTKRHSSGNIAGATSGNIFRDNEPHIVVWRNGYLDGFRKTWLEVDGVTHHYGNTTGTPVAAADDFWFGGWVTGHNGLEIRLDCYAMWTSILSTVQIDDIVAKFLDKL